MGVKICLKCGKENETNSSFCLFCGEKLTEVSITEKLSGAETSTSTGSAEPFVAQQSAVSMTQGAMSQDIKKEVPQKAKKKHTWVYVVTALLVAGLFAGVIVYFNGQIKEKDEAYKALTQEKEEALAKLETANGKIEELESSVADLETEKETLESEKLDLMADNTASLLEKTLFEKSVSSASTTNGVISVNNTVYTVKKGESITIKVNWKKSATMYLGTSTGYISADWVQNAGDVKVTGEKVGYSTITFSSDESASKDKFSIVVICYE